MRNLRFLLISLLSVLLLVSCGGKKAAKEVTAVPGDLAKQLAQDTVTSDTLSEVSTDIMASTYFVDTTKIEASSAYMSTGASACEAAIIKCSDASYAAEVETLFKNRVSNQTDLFSSYNAGETKKLENAIIKSSGAYVILCVCDDTAKAEEILKNAGF